MALLHRSKAEALREIRTQKTELRSLIDSAFPVVGKVVRKETNRYEGENVMKLAPSVEHNRMPGPGPVPGRRCIVGSLGCSEKLERRGDVEFLRLLPLRERSGASGPTFDVAALSLAYATTCKGRKRERALQMRLSTFYTTIITGMKQLEM